MCVNVDRAFPRESMIFSSEDRLRVFDSRVKYLGKVPDCRKHVKLNMFLYACYAIHTEYILRTRSCVDPSERFSLKILARQVNIRARVGRVSDIRSRTHSTHTYEGTYTRAYTIHTHLRQRRKTEINTVWFAKFVQTCVTQTLVKDALARFIVVPWANDETDL